jgi:glycosyltransferase involved in cell wall biosynthesis
MRLCYVLLSPTFGMHQYTADLANRLARAGWDIHLVTTRRAPRCRYTPAVTVHTPIETTGTGFSPQALRLPAFRQARQTIRSLHPDLVHFTGPHAWNVPLIKALSGPAIPVIHTLHDLDPHSGTRYGLLLHLWNRWVVGAADHILVHGQTYRQRLLGMGVNSQRVTWTPLLHLFLGGTWLVPSPDLAAEVAYEPWALFFGRLEPYKGIDYLLTACTMLDGDGDSRRRVVLAGPGNLAALWVDPLPPWLELRNHLVVDEEAVDLFRRCGLLVLPYVDATQSALIAAAYYFRKPVVVSRTGALPEYVVDGRTGCLVEPDHPAALARCLEWMLGDPARLAGMGEAGRSWYDAQRAAEERTLIQMYSRLARAKPSDEPTIRAEFAR